MDTVQVYKEFGEKKEKTFYIRVDNKMISKLRGLREDTGITISELIRESIRRFLTEIETTGSINLKIKKGIADETLKQ